MASGSGEHRLTLPPSDADAAALEFGRRVAESRRPSLLRELAEAWAELADEERGRE